jgi:hypothetical protein
MQPTGFGQTHMREIQGLNLMAMSQEHEQIVVSKVDTMKFKGVRQTHQG